MAKASQEFEIKEFTNCVISTTLFDIGSGVSFINKHGNFCIMLEKHIEANKPFMECRYLQLDDKHHTAITVQSVQTDECTQIEFYSITYQLRTP